MSSSVVFDLALQGLISGFIVSSFLMLIGMILNQIVSSKLRQVVVKTWFNFLTLAIVSAFVIIIFLEAALSTQLFSKCFTQASATISQWDSQFLVTIWLVAVVLLLGKDLLRLIAGLREIRKLENVVNPKIEQMLATARVKLRIRQPVQIKVNPMGVSAFVAGYFSPSLVISEELLSNTSEKDIENVIYHELIHLSDRDTTWLLLLGIMKRLLFFNPFVYLFFRQYQLTLEKTADEEALTLFSLDPGDFISTLLNLAEKNHPDLPIQIGLSASKSFEELKLRIECLAQFKLQNKKSLKTLYMSAVTGICLVLGLSIAHAQSWAVRASSQDYGMCLQSRGVEFFDGFLKTEILGNKNLCDNKPEALKCEI